MNDVVFVLGAGASVHTGVPLMASFLDRGRDLLAGGRVEDAKDEFRRVFHGITALQPVHSKAHVDIHNVESVFSAFEMAKLLGAFGPFTIQDLNALIDAMPVVISRTVEEMMRLTVDPNSGVNAPRQYVLLAEGIRRILNETRPERNVTVLSFNYDVGLELALLTRQVPFSYALSTAPARCTLLKLHGSVGWFRCSCGGFLEFDPSSYNWDPFHLKDSQTVTMRIGEVVSARQLKHCASGALVGRAIVPPVWNKIAHHGALSSIWATAADRLRTAESIIVVGYSLPQTDEFFRYLYALGSVGDLPLRRFWVFDKDTSPATESRYRSLLGRGAENRFEYFPQEMRQFVAGNELKTV